MREDLMLNVTNFEATEENYDSLREAVQKLSSASEAQFESIKKEKWYNRVFDMVTFSQKGKKRLAEQIGTVAQAQQILLELLLRLSANDAKVSELVLQNKNSIERIQEQNIYLLSRVKRLENVALGIKKDTDISDLSVENREILCAVIYYINQKTGDSSDVQKTFANAVLNYLDVADVQMDNPFARLGNLDNDSKRKILACCMEYMFLKKCTEDSIDEYEEVLDEFDFGRKTLKEISKQIQAIYNLRGAEGFYGKYQMDEFEDFDDTFYADFLEDTEIEDEPLEMEDLYVNNMLHVSSEDTKKIEYKNVHINSYINCEGTLEFHNCVIIYNETADIGKIKLADGSRLGMWNCVVICKGYDKNYLITGSDIRCLWFEKTTFIDCCFLAKLSCGMQVRIQSCELQNCVTGFIDFTMDRDSKFIMTENVVIEKDIPGFLRPEHFNMSLPSMIKTYYYDMNDSEDHICEVFDNVFTVEGRKTSFRYRYHLEGGNMMVLKCSFKGIENCVNAYQVEDCHFIDCDGAIWAKRCEMEEYGTNIDNCVFENCTNVVALEQQSRIRKSQFISCYDSVIRGDLYGGIELEFCEFINTSWKKEKVLLDHACISMARAKDSSAKANYIRKCIFNGVDMKDAFLIMADGYEKPNGIVTRIEDCDFRNCITGRNSGKIIKEYLKYDTLLIKNQEFQANILSGCRGLDRVNKEKGKVEEINITKKMTNEKGEMVGSALKAVASGAILAVGAPLPTAIVAGVNVVSMISKSNEKKSHKE